MFVKGKSGNPAGRPAEGKSWPSVLARLGMEKIKFGDDMITKKEAVARKLWSEAAKGESWAINALMNRMDGLPHQTTQEIGDNKLTVIHETTQDGISPD